MDIRDLNFAGEQLCPDYGNTAETGAFLFGFSTGAMWLNEKNSWIEFLKKQPSIGTQILVFTKTKTLKTAIFSDDTKFYEVGDNSVIQEVTHWLPLPELPGSDSK